MNKKLIAILTLVMFAITLLPMGAFAATTNSALQVKTVSDAASVTVGDVRITETEASVNSVKSGDEVIVTLLNGAEWASVAGTPTFTGTITAVEATIGSTVVAPTSTTKTSVTFLVPARTATDRLSIDIDLGNVNTSDVNGSEVIVDIYSVNGGVNNGSVTVAKIDTGSTNATALTVERINRDKAGEAIGTLRVVENSVGSLKEDETIDIVLPRDVNFDLAGIGAAYAAIPGASGLVVTTGGGSVPGLTVQALINTNDSGDARLRIKFVGIPAGSNISTGSPAVITIEGMKVHAKTAFDLGDLEVTVGGDATSQKVILARVADVGVTLESSKETVFYAGDNEQKVANFFIKETAEGSIIGDGRTIRMTLTDGMAWERVPATVNADKGNLGALTFSTYEDNRKTVVYRIAGAPAPVLSTVRTEYKLSADDFRVAIKADTEEKDVKITFAGSAGVTGELAIGKIVKPVTVKSEIKDIVVGKKNQQIGDIYITEVKAGYIEKLTSNVAGTSKLNVQVDFDQLPLASKPNVEVVEGDLKIDTWSYNGAILTITIDGGSKVASTIKISNIALDVDRTPAEGDYSFGIMGTALNKIGNVTLAAPVAPDTTPSSVRAARDGMEADWDDRVVEFVGAVVVTPAPDQEGVVKPVTMTVGSTVYTVGDVEMTMDVAPYIKNSRTYFPVRYVANALNITNDNVVWDGAQRTVTIFKGNRIVQVTIGSTTMLVNGVPLTMDVAPEITAERTMLPIRFVAQGLGAIVDFDAATQAVTLR